MEGNSTNSSNHESNIPTLDDNVTHSSKQLSIAMNDVAQWFEAFPQGSIIGWEELMNGLLVKLNPSQRIVKPEAEVHPFTQEKEIEGARAVISQNKQMHQQTLQQLDMMAKKITELRHAVVHTYNLTQSSYGCNQAEHSFGVINHEQQSYEQLQSPSNHSSVLQHRPQNDVYNPPWRTHSNGRGVENQNQRPRDFNCNNPSFKNQLKTHPHNNNHTHFQPRPTSPFAQNDLHRPPQLTQPQPLPTFQRIYILEMLMERFMKIQEMMAIEQEEIKKHQEMISKNQEASLRRLERQMEQLVQNLAELGEKKGTLNPKSHEKDAGLKEKGVMEESKKAMERETEGRKPIARGGNLRQQKPQLP